MSFSLKYTISRPARNLIIAILGGLAAGTALWFLGLIGLFIQDNSAVEHGWIVPIFTSIFVAPPILLGILDVAFNAIAIYFLDPLLSSIYTDKQYYTVFLTTAVFGNILSLLNGPNVISFGASGGVFGLIAGALAYDYAYNKRFNPTFAGWFLFIFIYSSLSGSADLYAHLGGALAGIPLGYYIGSNKRTNEIRGTTWRYGYP